MSTHALGADAEAITVPKVAASDTRARLAYAAIFDVTMEPMAVF